MVSQKEEEKKRRERERKKQRYAEDPDYREKILARNDAAGSSTRTPGTRGGDNDMRRIPNSGQSVSLNVPSPTANTRHHPRSPALAR